MIRRVVAVFALVTGLIGAWACNNTPKQVTISDGQATPTYLHVSRRAGDHVVWKNTDGTNHTVVLEATPFDVGDLEISVPANGTSRPFTISHSANVGRYKYDIHSSALPDSGPGPVVIVDE